MNEAGAERRSRPFRATHPLSSIRARILAGILLVLALLVTVSVVVWQASSELEVVLAADAVSLRSAQQGSAARIALMELRWGVADYLRSGGTAERDALESAMDRLERAATAAEGDDPASVALGRMAVAAQIRAEMRSVSDAAEARRVAAGLLEDTAAVLGNSATTLTQAASRTGDRSLAEPAAALLSAASRIVAASTRFSRSDSGVWTSIATSDAARVRTLLGGSLNVVGSPPRIQRLAIITADALDALMAATAQLRARPEINALIRSKISEPYQGVKVIEFDHLSPDDP